MKYLIVGLGNMDADYELTRHNIGFLALNQLAAQHTVKFQTARLAAIASFKYRGRTLCLIQPTTYMNHSGKAVSYWMKLLKLPIENNLIVTDDIALPFGKLRIKPRGSSGGHNGLKSIEEWLGTQNYPRLRLGIGNHFSKGKQADYVLRRFNSQEQESLSLYLDKVKEVIFSFCTAGISATMNRYNG